MSDVAEIQIMKVSAFTVGSSTYSGTKNFRCSETPLNVYPVVLEGGLRPVSLEQIQTDAAPVNFSIQSSSAAAKALSGTSADTATITGKDVVSGDDKTITLDNPSFNAVDLSAQNKSVDGVTITGTATAYDIA